VRFLFLIIPLGIKAHAAGTQLAFNMMAAGNTHTVVSTCTGKEKKESFLTSNHFIYKKNISLHESRKTIET